MIRLLGILCVAAALWSGWWALATTGAEYAIRQWLEARIAEGWQAETSTISKGGYPTHIALELEALQLADPATGLALQADALSLHAPSWWPGDVTLTLPTTPVRLASPEGAVDIQATDAQAVMHLHPGPSLQLERMSATSGPWQMTTSDGATLKGTDFRLAMLQDPEQPSTYRMDINITDLAPGGRLRRAVPADWPLTFDAYQARMTVTFDRPWDRYAVQDQRPQPRIITLDAIEITWGPLRHLASGRLTLDATGLPHGQLDLRVENWRQAAQVAESSGALRPDFRPQAEAILGMLANLGGDPETLNLSLRFVDGTMNLGPIPLGPAPRIVLR